MVVKSVGNKRKVRRGTIVDKTVVLNLMQILLAVFELIRVCRSLDGASSQLSERVFFLDFLTLEEGSKRLSRNFGTELLLNAA
jgi:hypothetical protein